MAKFGYLYLKGGKANGRQIVASQWIEESVTNSTAWSNLTWGDVKNYNYGYLWWLGEIGSYKVHFALGHGGQFIINIPQADMVIVSTANPNFDWDVADEHERTILKIFANYVVPAIKQ